MILYVTIYFYSHYYYFYFIFIIFFNYYYYYYYHHNHHQHHHHHHHYYTFWTTVVTGCDFVKKQDNTVLRVAWNGDFRLIHKGARGSCRRLYFTLNGVECSQPQTIDTPVFSNVENGDMINPQYGNDVICLTLLELLLKWTHCIYLTESTSCQ